MKICPNCNKQYFDDEGSYCFKCNYRLKHIENTGIDNREIILAPHKVENEDGYADPIITCPYCQSTNTKKISTTSKVAHTALFGVFSMSRNSKNFHCNKCGADF